MALYDVYRWADIGEGSGYVCVGAKPIESDRYVIVDDEDDAPYPSIGVRVETDAVKALLVAADIFSPTPEIGDEFKIMVDAMRADKMDDHLISTMVCSALLDGLRAGNWPDLPAHGRGTAGGPLRGQPGDTENWS